MSVRWEGQRVSSKVALVVLAGVRVALALLAGYMALTWAGLPMWLWAAWLSAFAVLVLRCLRWAVWVTIVENAVVVLAGLATLPNFGHLHGTELFAYLALPALVQLVAGAAALISNKPHAKRTAA